MQLSIISLLFLEFLAVFFLSSSESMIFCQKDFKKFREENDLRVRKTYGTKEIKKALPPEDFAFGKPNRPSTPVKGLIGTNPSPSTHSFAFDDEQAMILGMKP